MWDGGTGRAIVCLVELHISMDGAPCDAQPKKSLLFLGKVADPSNPRLCVAFLFHSRHRMFCIVDEFHRPAWPSEPRRKLRGSTGYICSDRLSIPSRHHVLYIVDEFTRTYMAVLASKAHKFSRIYLFGSPFYFIEATHALHRR